MGVARKNTFIRLSRTEAVLAINILSLGLILPFIGEIPLFDWDEINFAEISREMLLSGNFTQIQVDFAPFHEKPPLFFWIQALCMKLFGINEFAARLPNTLAALATVNSLFFIGERLRHWRMGLLWVVVYMGSLLPHFYFKSGIIDPWFNLFMFLSVYSVYLSAESKKISPAIIAGVWAGLAVLTKGPVAWLIPGVAALFFILYHRKMVFSSWQIVCMLITSTGLPALWFGMEYMQNGAWFISEFIDYQIRLFSTEDAGHGGFPGYHIIVLLLGCFPASFFALAWIKRKMEWDKAFKWLCVCTTLFILLLFSVVQSKIVHYSSFAYFPISYLGAAYIYEQKNDSWPTILRIALALTSFLLAAGLWFLAFKGPQVLDYFATHSSNPEVEAALSLPVSWPQITLIPAFLFTFIFISTIQRFKAPFVYPLFILTAISVESLIYAYTGTAYRYAYEPMIEFYQKAGREDAHLYTHGFKTYADKFYAEKMPEEKWAEDFDPLHSSLDKPVYIISKLAKKGELLSIPGIDFIEQKGCFVFYRRLPAPK